MDQGTSSMQNTNTVYEEQVHYWQSKNAVLQQKIITNSDTYKWTSATKEVFIWLVFAYPVLYCLLIFVLSCLRIFLQICCLKLSCLFKEQTRSMHEQAMSHLTES